MINRFMETDKMSNVINSDYRLLQIISRFGITLGFNEKTIKEVCDEQNVDCQTFLAVLNISEFGEKDIESWTERVSLSAITDYLRQAHSYFLEFQLPVVRRKLVEAMDCSTHNEVSFLILKFYDESVSEIRRHMEHEDEYVFNYVDLLLKGEAKERITLEASILHPRPIEQKISELKNIIIKYCKLNSNNNLMNAVLYDIFMCEEDLYKHCKLEDVLFIPAVHLYEDCAKERTETQQDELNGDTSEILSDREKEIVVYVVKGLTNKEIADKLFLSINTVTTHRRNIARKLDIHSSSGLTIYAIVNKLVQLDEIQPKS